jgi:geranylgeranyl diphosphate synthase type II
MGFDSKSNYELKQWFTNPAVDDAKIATVKIFNFQVVRKQQDAIQDFTFKAFETLDKMNLDAAKKMF